MTDAWTITRVRIPEYPAAHGTGAGRLGRHRLVDSRAAAYPYRAPPGLLLAPQLWTRRIPILDQGNVGSCTGEEQTGVLGTDPFWATLTAATQATLNQAGAYALYSQAETLDGDGPYPPNDNGSTGPSVAKAAMIDGLVSGYTHAATVDDMAAALQDGPVGIGINWYDSFDRPDSGGGVAISPGAQVRGGHEVEVRGVDPGALVFRADNSWGPDWGALGSFHFTFDTMARLLAEGGDCTVCVPLTAPAPVPVPVPSAGADAVLWAAAGPWAAQSRTRPDLAELKAALVAWAAAKGLS